MIDLIITWPTCCDYPVWRAFLRRNRERFGKVIIPFMEANKPLSFKSFVESAMALDVVDFIDPKDLPLKTADWRDNAVNAALERSTSDWVWFTEQDFFIDNPDWFFEEVLTRMKKYDVLFFHEADRKHPACMFVKRSAIEKTRKNFGVVPEVGDHFCGFVSDLMRSAQVGDIPGKSGIDYLHMNGLSHNYNLVADASDVEGVKDVYRPDFFQIYNTYARLQTVEQDPRFTEISLKADRLLFPISQFFKP